MEPNKKDFRLQLYARATAPCRDYYGLTINNDTIILNTWNISYGPHVYPKRTKSLLSDYPENKSLQNDIQRIFGDYVNDYIIQLAKNQILLQCLPTKAFLCVLGFLAKKDIIHLSQTSKIFFQICQTNLIWKVLFEKTMRRKANHYENQEAGERDWKEALRQKMVFIKRPTTTGRGIMGSHSASKTLSNIRYTTLKLDTDDKKPGKITKPGGDAPMQATNKSTIPENVNIRARKSILKNPTKAANTSAKTQLLPLPDKVIVEEQYTSTIARKSFLPKPGMKTSKTRF